MEISAPDFDLEKTLDSGQVFHWEKAAKGFVGTIGDCAVYIEQGSNVLAAWNNEEKLDGLKPSSLQEEAGLRRLSQIISRLIIRSEKSVRHFRTIRLSTRHDSFVAAYESFASRNGNAWLRSSVRR